MIKGKQNSEKEIINLKNMDKKYNIIPLLIEDLMRYMSLVPNDFSEEIIYEGIYPHNINIEQRLKLIFYFFNPNSRDYCINQIKELGYDKYQGFLLFDEKNIVSLVFDMNQNQIGNAYKYNQSINDYTKYNINFEIRKIFLLYLNERQLLRKHINNKFRDYYIIDFKNSQMFIYYPQL